MESILFDDVTKVYGGHPAARGVAVERLSLAVPKGEVFGFLGPNGAGKSTSIKILLNLIFPTSGRALMLGRPVADEAVRKWVGYLPENPNWYDYLTPEELLWYGGSTSGMSRLHIKERAAGLLDLVDLTSVRRRRLKTFSKGMLQRAGVAFALINDPEVIVLDEPMSGLDPLGRKLMADLIRRLKEEGKTVFFSSHILHDVEDLCDRVGIIAKGRLRRVARLSDLLAVRSKGWTISVKDAPQVLRSRLADFEPDYSARGSFTEIRVPEKDLGKVMERLGSSQSEIVSVTPLRPTLEEVVLREIQQTDGNVG